MHFQNQGLIFKHNIFLRESNKNSPCFDVLESVLTLDFQNTCQFNKLLGFFWDREKNRHTSFITHPQISPP
jgi:hypothetical protein